MLYYIQKTIHIEIFHRNVHNDRLNFPYTWLQFIKPKIEYNKKKSVSDFHICKIKLEKS